MGSRLVVVASILVIVVFGFGCEAYQAYQAAKEAFDRATQMHADYLAPYEYVSAELYLKEAKKQLDESDFATAINFANRSYELSIEAMKIAEEKSSKPQIPFLEGKKLREKFGLPWPPEGEGKSQQPEEEKK